MRALWACRGIDLLDRTLVRRGSEVINFQDVQRIDEDMRVLIFGHSYVVRRDRAWIWCLVDACGVSTVLIVPFCWRNIYDGTHVYAITSAEPFPCYAIRGLFSGRAGAFLFNPLCLIHKFFSFRPDVIHVHQEVFQLSAFQFAVFSRLFGAKFTLTTNETKDQPIGWVRRWTRKYVLSRADAILVSARQGEERLRAWGYGGRVIVGSHLGVDTSLFTPARRTRSEGEFVVGFVGRYVAEKGIDLLLRAVHRLGGAGRDITILLCGSGPEEPSLRALAERLSLSGRIRWVAPVAHEEVAEIMGRLHVLVLPSRTTETWEEQFGMVLIEAMASGVAVAGSRCGAIPDVIGRSDLVFAENDDASLAAILGRLIAEPAWRREIEDYGTQRVARLYSAEAVARQWVDVWQDLCKREQQLSDPAGTEAKE